MTIAAKDCRSGRRWFQFALRTVLLVTVMMSIPLWWLSAKLERAKRQRIAVEEIERVGGFAIANELDDISSAPNDYLTRVFRDNCSLSIATIQLTDKPGDPPVENQLLARTLPELSSATTLNLNCANVTSAAFDTIAILTNLERLSLQNARVAGPEFGQVVGLTRLHELQILDSDISDADLVHLPQLNNLKAIRLESPNISDHGLFHLSCIATLRSLEVSSPSITDAGLAHLRTLKALRLLVIRGTRDGQVTAKGVSQLREYLPKCQIFAPNAK